MKSPIIIRRVVGHSMEPTLKQGKIVFATHLRSPREGDVVVADVDGRELIKRIKSVDENGYFLVGDNSSHSRDSHRFGMVEKSNILGVVLTTK